jgi:hypothetical protein
MIDVYVGVSSLRHQNLIAQKAPVPGPLLVKALVDTGASHTTIDVALVKQLALVPTGTVSVITPSTGTTPCEMLTYDCGIWVPLQPGFFAPRPFWIAGAAELLHQGFSVLFGWDLLAESTLFYDGKNGTFTLSF